MNVDGYIRRLGSQALLLALLLPLMGCPFGPAPSAGRYFDVGGYYLFHIDTGPPPDAAGKAGPTVVFMTGLGETLKTWDKVRPEVAKFARTISYDRGGVGWSDRGPDPRTGSEIVRELHKLLSGAKIPPPYILVPHSVAGVYARLYANAYPSEVAGIVLIDTRHEDTANRQALYLPAELAKKLEDRFRITVPFTTIMPGSLGEYLNFENTAMEVRANRDIPSVPLIFLGRGIHQFDFLGVQVDAEQAFELQNALVDEQVRLAPKGEYREVANAMHAIQSDAPKAVVQAIRDIMERAADD